MARLVTIILLSFIVASCTSRIEYDKPQTQIGVNTININTAGANELRKLPGVGDKTAEAIVEYRERHGAFRRVEHIMLVPRVGERRFAELRPYIRVE